MQQRKTVVDTNSPEVEHYQWAAGCEAWVLMDTPSVTIKEERMAPGTREQLHLHKNAAQFFYIPEGKAVFYLEGKAHHLRASQGLQVSAISSHNIANESNDPVRILVTTTPTYPITNESRPGGQNGPCFNGFSLKLVVS